MTLNRLYISNGVMFPIYDPDTNLVYLCGKVMIMSWVSEILKILLMFVQL